MENGCICTTGGASVRALGAAALLCTALTGAVLADDDTTFPECNVDAGDCFAAGGNGTPGCDDLTCCRTVCACDPFCCGQEGEPPDQIGTWDTYCAGSGFAGNGCGAALLCAQPAAACCIDGVCETLDSLACVDAGGIYQGAGTDCATTECGVPPANDDCGDAIELMCGDSVVVDNTFATTEVEENSFPLSCHFDGPNIVVGSVWYYIVGTGDTIQIDTCSSVAPADDTLIAVYGGELAIPECYVTGEVACSEDACGANGLLSRTCFDTIKGNVYMILVGSFAESDRGEITVNVTCPCPEGACCFEDGSCIDTNETDCVAQGGEYQGDDTDCATTECPLICGPTNPNDCFSGNTTPGCSDLECCETVCACDPFCCDTAWDDFCALDGFPAGSGCGAHALCEGAPTGACCLTDGTCMDDLDQLECANAGGTYQGNDTVCADLECPSAECPKGATLENEPDCGDFDVVPPATPTDTVNGGCNTSPEVFSPIECGETYCGSTAQGTDFRDTDWYEVVTTEQTIFTFTVTGTISMQIGYVPTSPIGSGNCADAGGALDPFATGAPFVETSITTACLPAGTHWFFVSTGAAGTFPCPSDYVATLTCESPCIIPIGACCLPDFTCLDDVTDVDCAAQGGTFIGDGTVCADVNCSPCSEDNPNSCFEGNTTPGCNDVECCETVCACDPFCCATAWDTFCANTGFPEGSGCGAVSLCTGAEGACCFFDGTCTDGMTPVDCTDAGGDFQGDGSECASVECPQICGSENPNDCFAVDNTTPGCSDAECCTIVCACDPFCCETAWDEFCAGEGFEGNGCGAELLCAGPTCPPDCVTSATFEPPPDGIVDGADLAVLLGSWDGTPDVDCSVPGSCCVDTVTSATFMPPPDGNVDGADLAVLLGAWGDPGCEDGFP